MSESRIRSIAIAAALIATSAAWAPLTAQVVPDSLRLSLWDALEIGLRQNPQVLQAGYSRSAAGAGKWEAYGNLLPDINLQGLAQKSGEGEFVGPGVVLPVPEQYSTFLELDFSFSLLDAGRDIWRIKGANANADEAISAYDLQSLQTGSEIKVQYLRAKRAQAHVSQARREIEQREEQLRVAEGRYEVGAVTISDVLQGRLNLNQAEVGWLEARQSLDEAALTLRRLLGGELEPGPISFVTRFEVFPPEFDLQQLIDQSVAIHPAMQEVEARQRSDEAGLWIARSQYWPTVRFDWVFSRTRVDTTGFGLDDFNKRDYYGFSLNWETFGGFRRYNDTSQANARLQSTKAEMRERTLAIEEGVRLAHSRLQTAHASYNALEISLELAREDLRLGEERYRTGAGSFVDLTISRTRATQAETDLISAAFEFFIALVELERATGLMLFSAENAR